MYTPKSRHEIVFIVEVDLGPGCALDQLVRCGVLAGESCQQGSFCQTGAKKLTLRDRTTISCFLEARIASMISRATSSRS